MNLYQYLIDQYGYDEPILLEDLTNEVESMKPNTLRQSLKRMVDSGKMCRYENGIYFIPNPSSILKSRTISVNKIINKKYLYKNGSRIGYTTGLSFANRLRLTTQNPSVVEIVTLAERAIVRSVNLNKRKIKLRRPRVEINDKNYKLLQVLDLLTNYDKLSTEPISKASEIIIEYLSDVEVTKDTLNKYLVSYPGKTSKNMIESGLYDALTQG